MSAITWSSEISSTPHAAGTRSRAVAKRAGFALGLVAATVTTQAMLLFAVLMASGILEF